MHCKYDLFFRITAKYGTQTGSCFIILLQYVWAHNKDLQISSANSFYPYWIPPVFIPTMCFRLCAWITFCTCTRTSMRANTTVDKITGREDWCNIHKQNYIKPPYWPTSLTHSRHWCRDLQSLSYIMNNGRCNLYKCTLNTQSLGLGVHDSAMDLTSGVELHKHLCVWLVISFMKKSLHSFNAGVSITAMRHSKIFACRCCLPLYFGRSKRLPEKLLI